jgi:hypothetical protein
MRRTVRIVLDTLDLCRNAVLVATEIDHTILLTMTTALVPRRDMTVVVPTSVLLWLSSERIKRSPLYRLALTTRTTARRPAKSV